MSDPTPAAGVDEAHSPDSPVAVLERLLGPTRDSVARTAGRASTDSKGWIAVDPIGSHDFPVETDEGLQSIKEQLFAIVTAAR